MGAQEFYIRRAGDAEASGPFSLVQLTSLAESGGVTEETLSYDSATDQWVTLQSNADLKAAFLLAKKSIPDGRTVPGTAGTRPGMPLPRMVPGRPRVTTRVILAFVMPLIILAFVMLLMAAVVSGGMTWIPAVLLALAALGGWKLMDRLAPPPPPPLAPLPPLPPLRDLSPSAMQQRLSELVHRPKPDMGALCYSIEGAGPAETRAVHNHICSSCGNRTSYAPKAGNAYWAARGLPHLRSLLVPLSALGAELDERELCAHCSPGVKAPAVTLILRPPGAPERRIRGVTDSDLKQLSAFLAGDEYPDSPLFPLQYDPRRLAELLGLEKP